MIENNQEHINILTAHNNRLKEALESIAFNECPEQGTEEYWANISNASIIETIVNDTNIARKALKATSGKHCQMVSEND